MGDIIIEHRSLVNIERYLVDEVKGKELWGDLNISLEEYEILRAKIKETLGRMQIEEICKRYPVSLTTLMVFLMRYKYNLNFWGLFAEELSIYLDADRKSFLGKCTRNMFDRYGFDYSEVKDERRVNIGPILYEAGLPPESSLDDLFYVLKYDTHTIFDPVLIIDDLIDMRSYKIRKPLLKFLKRFKDKRAVDFLLDIQDAILSVDQNMAGSSCYVANYERWKEQERDRNTIAIRKKQEFQTRPYLTFENGKRGLCIVLPRSNMKDEWIQSVGWLIVDSYGNKVRKNLNVFGDEGRRYIESITVPVSPSEKYDISLYDDESIDEEKLLTWSIDGIKGNGIIFFNANGRMINPNYIPFPYGILIHGKNASIKNSKSLIITYQSYPTNQTDGGQNEYEIIAIEPSGRDAYMTYCVDGYERNISERPQVKIEFDGKTLFGIPADEKYNYFTEIPYLNINLEDGTPVKGLELRIGNKKLSLDELFEDGHVSVGLKSKIRGVFTQYGTYSVRLYQSDNFIKQAEFNYVPNIKTDYSPVLDWPDKETRNQKRILKFERPTDWSLEFPGCVVKNDEKNYIVECLPRAGTILITLRSEMEDVYFSHQMEIPVRPFEISILKAWGEKIENNGKMLKIDLDEFQEQYWIGLGCYGDYRGYHYRVRLRTYNGIEQSEPVSLSYGGCGNLNLSCFNDTLRSCPLPAQIELSCDDQQDKILPIMMISDNTKLKKRPGYGKQGLLLVDSGDKDKDLTIKKFADKTFEIDLLHKDIRKLSSKAGDIYYGYRIETVLTPGIYIFQNRDSESFFDFEDESEAIPSNDSDTIYVSNREKNDPIFSFSDWLDQLIKDILKAGVNKDLKESVSYRMLDNLKGFSEKNVAESDLVKLISLAYFYEAKCINEKRNCIDACMHMISEVVLNGSSRYEMIKMLADLDCEPEIFEKCMKNYNLLLFEVGQKDSKQLAEKIENKSVELSLLLRMGIDDSVHNTIWREKYRELLGKESIRTMLSVPNEEDPTLIAEEQRKFLREQKLCKVHINLTREISGDMKPIQEMISFRKNDVYLDLRKKPDFGIYMDYIRYVDQYVNWYKASHDRKGEMYKWKKDRMISLVESDCSKLVKGLKDIRTLPELKSMVNRYEDALSYRFDGNPENYLSLNKYDRFFYLQGLAAFLAKLPIEYRKHFAYVIRPAEHFMTVAMTIAPRIAQRDLIMASTFIYLVRKEDKLCR